MARDATQEPEEESATGVPEPLDVPGGEDEPDELDEPGPPDDETAPDAEGRCQAETTVGGNLYRCALQAEHDGEHSFTPVDAGDDGEPAPEPQGPTDQELEAAVKRLGAEKARHESRVAQIMGEAFGDLIPCPRCLPTAPGFCYPLEVAPISDEQRIAVKASIGEEVLPDYRADPYRRKCGTCDGWGRVYNESHVANEGVKPCDDCKSKGWRDTRAPADRPAVPDFPPTFTLPVEATNGDEPEHDPTVDVLGTPMGAPYYGMMAQYRPTGWQDEVAAWKLANAVA